MLALELVEDLDLQHKSIALGPPDYRPFKPPVMRIGLLDVIPRVPTRSSRVDYVRQTRYVNAAAAVAEGAAKQESTLEYQSGIATTVTIAHWVPITTKMLADSAVVEAVIDSELVYGLNRELERQMLRGAGGVELVGILNDPAINTWAATTDDTVDGALRHGATLVMTVGEAMPDAVLLHPNDAEFLSGWGTYAALEGFGGGMVATTWGTTLLVLSLAMPVGTGLVGNFQLGCMLFDRQNGHVDRGYASDGFIRNIQVLRAELDAAFAVLRPAVFTKVTGLNA